MTTEAIAQDQAISLDGLNFHYRDWGEVSAPPLVLLHGITGHSHTWDRFAPAMADRFRVLALDQRGHGESDWAPQYSTQLMATDLHSFASALAIRRFRLVGHSMGGINSYYFAAHHPEQVERLVIGDFGPDIAASTGSAAVRARVQAAASASFQTVDEAIRAAQSANPRASADDVRHRVLNNLRQRDDGRWIWRYDTVGLATRRLPALTAEEQWPILAKIACPTLIVRGADSDALSHQSAEHMVDVIPDCRLIEVENAGHSIPLDNPSGWLAAVRPFLLERL